MRWCPLVYAGATLVGVFLFIENTIGLARALHTRRA